MAQASEFKIIITALNHATAGIRAAKEDFRSMTQPIREVGVAVNALAEESGFASLAQHGLAAFRKIGHFGIGTIKTIGKEILTLSGPLAALGAAAGGFGIFETVRSTIDEVRELGLASQKTGIAVGALQQLHYVGKVAGLEPEMLDKGLARLNTTLGLIAMGHGKQAAAVFRHFGISVRDARGHMRTGIDVIGEMSEAVEKHKNIIVQTAIANAGFQGKLGKDFLPLLLLGKGRIRELTAEFVHLHGVLDAAELKVGMNAAQAFNRLDLAASGLKESIGLALAPAIIDLINPLTEWIATNRELVSTKVKEWATGLGTYLENVDWGQVATDLKDVADSLGAVAKGLIIAGEAAMALTGGAKYAGKNKKTGKLETLQQAQDFWHREFGWRDLFGDIGLLPKIAPRYATLGPTPEFLARMRGERPDLGSPLSRPFDRPIALPSPSSIATPYGDATLRIKVDVNADYTKVTQKVEGIPPIKLDTGDMWGTDWISRSP